MLKKIFIYVIVLLLFAKNWEFSVFWIFDDEGLRILKICDQYTERKFYKEYI